MADHQKESLLDKIADKIHGHHSSSSDSEDVKESSIKAKVYRLFGRERPVHRVLGGGKPTDVFFVEEQEGVVGRSARRGYCCVGFVGCPGILPASIGLPWFDTWVGFFVSVVKCYHVHQQVIVGLWVLSIVGSWCDFLTLFYAITVLLFIVPPFYNKYEDKVDSLAEKIIAELKKQYAVFDAKVLSKIPRGPSKDKKRE